MQLSRKEGNKKILMLFYTANLMPGQRKVVIFAQNKDFNPANFDAG
ncbi:MAG: hypothetical protein AAFR99_15165 [Cyanobacteria bacterium J06629_9]